MGRHERHDYAEAETEAEAEAEADWSDEFLKPTERWSFGHDGKHRRDDSGEEVGE
jgi:hypothetical protein